MVVKEYTFEVSLKPNLRVIGNALLALFTSFSPLRAAVISLCFLTFFCPMAPEP